ncbi:MAG: DUF4446 family protein [Candidatus Paceibacterota bacterium]|jgi:hypothetical protein
MFIPSIDTTILVYIALGIGAILLIWVLALQLKLRRLLIGKDIQSLEKTFISVSKDLEDLKTFRKASDALHQNFDQRLQRSIQGVETIRFNPFKGTGGGGNQSFAIALADEKGDGVILSSLHARDRISIFAKAIQGGKSELELTDEEVAALTKAHEKALGK